MQNFLTLAVATLLLVLASAAHATPLYKAGTEFKDCADCPVMVVLPQQSFMMGSPDNEPGRESFDGPQRKVTIAYGLAVGKFEVTRAEWQACLQEGGCTRVPREECRAELGCTAKPDDSIDRGTFPVSDVNWNDAQTYVKWLSVKTGETYRLLSEAEWEYAARGNTSTTYSWGDKAARKFANYGMDSCCGPFASGEDTWELSSPVGNFPANGFDLHDMAGNVWEWVEDCWNENPATGPIDGSAREKPECRLRIMRGGSWASLPQRMRPAFRQGTGAGERDNYIGFRVARSN